jgi:flagellar biosynthesis/type III secretory pathway M-ring protein FliF/YscJ
MKLTPFSRLIIVLLVLVGAFLLIRNYVPQLQQSTDENTQVVQEEKDQAEETTKADNRKGGTAVFDYATPKPINGTLKGVVELGASGFNSFIINVDAQDRWELKKAEFGASLVYENMATEQDVRDGLKKYIATMLDFGVSGKEIHFMMSSSAVKNTGSAEDPPGLKIAGLCGQFREC